MIPNLPPISSQREKLADYVYEALCQHIIEGRLTPGLRLREAEVAQALEVSRTPVREAFFKLERQRFLHKDASGAYFVARWDKQTLQEVATLRGALEGLAMELAVERLHEADFDHLEAIVRNMEAALRRNDREQLIHLDIAFHSYLWSRTGHTLLQLALEDMKAQVLYFMFITRPGDETDYPSTHRQLIAVLRKGDPESAAQAVREHTLVTAEHAIGRLNLS